MEIKIVVLLSIFTVVLSEYPRYKYRPPLPKPPPYSPYVKKWQQPRPPVRSRPIPVHMPSHHKISMGVAPSIKRPVALPVRTFWKNTQTTFRTPIEKPYNNIAQESIVVPKKVFLSSPPIPSQDYQLQSNNIPIAYKTIKQIGEKGPIHTIPAPNLGPADKPQRVEEIKEIHHQPQTVSYVKIQKAHQYQVTETPSDLYKNYQEQNHQVQNYQEQNHQVHSYNQEQNHQVHNYQEQNHQVQKYQEQNHQVQNYNQEQNHQVHNYQEQNHQVQNAQQNDVPSFDQSRLNEYYQLFQQPQLALTLPVLSQEYIQSVPVLPQQLYQPEASDKIGTSQYFEEKKEQSLVTAGYNLEPTVSQSQYVQNFFDTRDDHVNNVEPDAKPSSQDGGRNITGFYVTLPNKEAAETLASLQAAGKLNSNLMQLTKNGQSQLAIYVPEDGKQKSGDEELEEEVGEESYDDYSQEDLMSDEGHQGGEFGHRLNPKTN